MSKDTYSKKDLARELAKATGLSLANAEKALAEIFVILERIIINNKKAVISNFGTFMLKKRKARMGRNPKTKEPVPIPEKWVPYIKFSPKLKEKVSSLKIK